jgi:hypothetical protein
MLTRLRELWTPPPRAWYDVDMSEEEELAAFNEGRADPAAPYTPAERETLAYLARVRGRRRAWLLRHRARLLAAVLAAVLFALDIWAAAAGRSPLSVALAVIVVASSCYVALDR